MKKLLFTILFIICLTISANAQDVTVPQSFVDRATQAFKEVVALRKAVAAQAETIKAKNETIEAKNNTLKIQKDLIAAKDKQITKLIAVTCTKSSFFIFVYRTKKCF